MANRLIKMALLGLLIIMAVIMAGLLLFGDRLIRGGAVQAASTSIGREVDIQDISLNLWRGEINLSGITLQNAEGYEFPFAMKLENAFIDTRPISLLGRRIQLKLIAVEGVEIFIEQRDLNNNLRDLLAGMPAREEPEGPKQTEGRTVNVETTRIEDITVHLKAGREGEDARDLKIKIDPIILENLGTEKEINSGAVAARIVAAIATGAIRQTADELPAEIVRQIRSFAEEAIDLENVIWGEGREIIEETGERLFEGVLDILRPLRKPN